MAALARAATADHAQRLAALEKSADGRLGVFGWNVATGTRLEYRADERFPLCSTFKVMLAGALLNADARSEGVLDKRLPIREQELVTYSPITGKHVGRGLSVAELCQAALQYSDNTAANLLIDAAGGTEAVTTYARAIGDSAFRLDRRETELNDAIPGDPRDTSTPQAMGRSLHALLLGNALPPKQRTALKAWMLGNTTGGKRIRAVTPANWQVADKTGSGNHGTTNDVAVLWSDRGNPICLCVYFTQPAQDAKWRDDVIRAATQIALEAVA
jgi:beta-lactamase class A